MIEVKRFQYDGSPCFVMQDGNSGEFFAVMFHLDPKECSDYWSTFGLCMTPDQYTETGWKKTADDAERELIQIYKDNWLRENPEQRHKWS